MSSSREFQSPQMVKVQRALTGRSFLLTYKHEKIFNKGELFQCCGSSKVEVCYWVCSREPHPNTSGFYYHMSIKMSGPKKKNFVKSELQEKPWDCCQLFYLIRKRAAMRKSGSEASATNNKNNVPWLGKFEVSQFILHENVKDQTTSAA